MAGDYQGSVVFRLRGDSLDPVRVSELLGLEADRSARKNEPIHLAPASADAGERFPVQLNLLRPVGVWQRFTPPDVARQPIEAQLAWWLEQLTKRDDALRQLALQGIEAGLSCHVRTQTVASFSLDTHAVDCLAALGVRLDVTIYAESDRGEESTEPAHRTMAKGGAS